MGHPRFLFVSDLDVRRSSAFVWPGSQALSRVGWVAWRLLAANNRELGRGYGVHRDHPACRRAILQLQRDIDRVDAVPRADTSGRWIWQASVRGLVVAVSARPYLREREAWSNLSQFVNAVPIAPVTEAVRPLTRRSGRGYATPPMPEPHGGQPARVLRLPSNDSSAIEMVLP